MLNSLHGPGWLAGESYILMVKHLLLLLGMPEGATVADIKKRYARLLERLSKRDSACPETVDDLQPARQRLSESFEHWKRLCGPDGADGAPVSSALAMTPKLGQVLVASGRLTLSDLLSVLSIQEKAGGQRFGELLVFYGYLSVDELDYFLHLQRVIELPLDHPERWGQRLVELGLLSKDQLQIALIEHRRTGCSLRSAIINRGWLRVEVLDRIF